jgi:opacity protein-like surface antigen
MSRILIPALVLALLSTPALATGYVSPAPAPAVVPVAPAPGTDWTGAYGGLQYEFLDGVTGAGTDFEGDLYGLFGGYRYDFGDYVLGGEIDYMTGEFRPATGGPALDIDSLLRVGVEAGFDAGRALIYGTAGYASMEASLGPITGDGDGVFYGLGIDYLVTDNITLGAELLRHEFRDFNSTPGNDFEFTSFGINVAYRF